MLSTRTLTALLVGFALTSGVVGCTPSPALELEVTPVEISATYWAPPAEQPAFPPERATPVLTPADAPPILAEPKPVIEAPSAPALRIDVGHRMSYSTTWEPPQLHGVYRVVDAAHGYGSTPAHTAFILGHSRTPPNAPAEANAWHDMEIGSAVVLDGVAHRVTARYEPHKNDVGALPIWDHRAGRAVLITCIPLFPGIVATHNLVLVLDRT